jgi:hypothetical protein
MTKEPLELNLWNLNRNNHSSKILYETFSIHKNYELDDGAKL